VQTNSPEHLRLFIAIRIPDSVKEKIVAAQTELRRALPPEAVRWTRGDQFHLTLRFLGSVAAERLPALADAVRVVCKSFTGLQLHASGLGFFPDSRLPRVIWVGINDRQGRLPLLHRAVQFATLGFTTEKAEETFTGHVTLGRVKHISRREAQSLASAATGLGNGHFGQWTVNHIDIMRSELSSEGAKHSDVAVIPLEQPLR
jgi:RNA 2',3'-cyclic 3'-phosphodiesterase